MPRQPKRKNNRTARKRRTKPARRPRASQTVSAPVNVSTRTRRTNAVVQSNAGHLRVRHRELFSNASASTSGGLVVVSESISASNPIMFPWLANIARAYQFYRFNSLRFEYEPSCPTTTAGTVYAVIDYNIHDAGPIDYTELSQNMGFRDCPAYGRLTSSYDRKQGLLRDKLMTGPVQADSDASLYRCGSLNYGTTVQSDTADRIGRWFASYDVTLMTPQAIGTAVDVTGGTTTYEFVAATGSAANIFGTTNTTPESGDSTTILGGEINFLKAGDYLATVQSSGTGGMDAAAPIAHTLGGGSGTLTDVILQTGIKTIFTFLLTGMLVGSKAYFSKVGVTGLGHTDVIIAPVDGSPILAKRRAAAALAASDAALAARISLLVLNNLDHGHSADLLPKAETKTNTA